MARAIQCDNCGAVLLKDELFCGECGAPRPSLTSADQVIEEPQADHPIRVARAGMLWRLVAVLLGFTGAILCLSGLAAFLILGLGEKEGVTPPENWLYSAICCLLPLAATGTAAALAALALWWARLRDRSTLS